jgi:hypothetical protein
VYELQFLWNIDRLQFLRQQIAINQRHICMISPRPLASPFLACVRKKPLGDPHDSGVKRQFPELKNADGTAGAAFVARRAVQSVPSHPERK